MRSSPLSSDRIKDADSWSKAPPLQGMSLVQGLKPAAEELAVNPKIQIAGKPAVAAAVQRAPGGGQVMVLTFDTTWRWSRLPRLLGQADTLYARFWSQSIRFLAGRSLEDQRPPLTVSTDRPDYEVNKRVTVKLERQADSKLDGVPQLSVEVLKPGGEMMPLPVKADAANPDLATAEFTPSVGGRYEVSARLTVGNKLAANQTAEFLVQGEDVELADTRVNARNLRDLSSATGGVFLEMDQAGKLAEKIPPKERSRTSPSSGLSTGIRPCYSRHLFWPWRENGSYGDGITWCRIEPAPLSRYSGRGVEGEAYCSPLPVLRVLRERRWG